MQIRECSLNLSAAEEEKSPQFPPPTHPPKFLTHSNFPPTQTSPTRLINHHQARFTKGHLAMKCYGLGLGLDTFR